MFYRLLEEPIGSSKWWVSGEDGSKAGSFLHEEDAESKRLELERLREALLDIEVQLKKCNITKNQVFDKGTVEGTVCGMNDIFIGVSSGRENGLIIACAPLKFKVGQKVHFILKDGRASEVPPKKKGGQER